MKDILHEYNISGIGENGYWLEHGTSRLYLGSRDVCLQKSVNICVGFRLCRCRLQVMVYKVVTPYKRNKSLYTFPSSKNVLKHLQGGEIVPLISLPEGLIATAGRLTGGGGDSHPPPIASSSNRPIPPSSESLPLRERSPSAA